MNSAEIEIPAAAAPLAFAGRTDVGLKRSENQDAWACDATCGIFLVTDGMGGQVAGSLASRVVATALPPLLQERLHGLVDFESPAAATALEQALVDLSERVDEETQARPELRGMGATVVALMVRGGGALVAHLGDSRAYLLRDGALERLTTDHSITQILLDLKEIATADVPAHPARGRITRYVGMPRPPHPDIRLIPLHPGDRLLLCTDGLTNMLPDDAICAHLNTASTPDDTCLTLIAAANTAGGDDNITAVVIDIPASRLDHATA